MLPARVVAPLPAMVRDDEDLNASLADGANDGPQVRDQADLLRDRLEPRPQLAAFGKEVVIRVDEQQTRSGSFIHAHGIASVRRPLQPRTFIASGARRSVAAFDSET